MLARVVALFFLFAALPVGPATAQRADLSREVIRDYWVLVEVGRDGSVTVSEEIEVVALGHQIRRGIYRDIPRGGIGPLNIGAADFQLIAAHRDNRAEPHHIVNRWDSVRIYLGHEEVILQPGVYRYRLVYRLSGQVDRFGDFDEIYWNATGNDWNFDIEKVRVTVVPPAGAMPGQVAAYTGRARETGRDAEISYDDAGRPVFTTTRPLRRGEGLTVAVGWPKGHVAPPSVGARLESFLRTFGGLAVAALTVGLVLIYYLFAWWRVGRDPPAGPIIPIYHPELPPAAMRFIRRMRFDDTCLSAAIISLAVKGHLVIREVSGKPILWRAEPGVPKQPMSDGEQVLFRSLLGVRDRVRVEDADRGVLQSASIALRRHFERTFNRHYFRRNYGWFAGGVAITILGWLLSALISVEQLEGLFVAFFPTFFLIGTATSGMMTLAHLRQFRFHGEFGDVIAAARFLIVCGLLLVLFTGSAMFVLAELGWLTLACLGGVALLNVLFFHLLKAPTAIGREALDEIEGTRLYLTVAEADRLKFHNPPEQTPEHFHELLPYAVALDVETAWTDQFSSAIEAARARGEEKHYVRPTWYSGSTGTSSLSDVTRLGRSLGGALSAATAPRSGGSGFGGGGGSSGGGSSGGGRGGGGGGGW